MTGIPYVVDNGDVIVSSDVVDISSTSISFVNGISITFPEYERFTIKITKENNELINDLMKLVEKRNNIFDEEQEIQRKPYRKRDYLYSFIPLKSNQEKIIIPYSRINNNIMLIQEGFYQNNVSESKVIQKEFPIDDTKINIPMVEQMNEEAYQARLSEKELKIIAELLENSDYEE